MFMLEVEHVVPQKKDVVLDLHGYFGGLIPSISIFDNLKQDSTKC